MAMKAKTSFDKKPLQASWRAEVPSYPKVALPPPFNSADNALFWCTDSFECTMQGRVVSPPPMPPEGSPGRCSVSRMPAPRWWPGTTASLQAPNAFLLLVVRSHLAERSVLIHGQFYRPIPRVFNYSQPRFIFLGSQEKWRCPLASHFLFSFRPVRSLFLHPVSPSDPVRLPQGESVPC